MIDELFELKRVELPKGPLDYYRAGQGPALLYLHSAGGPRLTEPLRRLTEKHTVYLPVLPGWDGTPFVDGIDTVQDLADHLAGFEEVIGEQVDVVGHSFGGWTALRLALTAPERIGQLVLEAPAGLHAYDTVPQGGSPEEIRRRFFAYPDRVPGVPADLAAANTAARVRYWGNSAGEDGVDEELVGRLGEIEAWTLVLLGTLDGIVPAATGQLLKNRLQHVYLMYVYDAAHGIEIDQPERFNRLVGEFLTRGEAFIINFGSAED